MKKLESFVMAELSIGLLGIAYGLIALFYYYAKISKPWALFFILPIVIGVLLIIKGNEHATGEEFQANTS